MSTTVTDQYEILINLQKKILENKNLDKKNV
jgi:hypothetical protein